MEIDSASLTLLDELIGSGSGWSAHRDFYLTILAPRIAQSESWEWLPQNERRIVIQLKERLSPEAWAEIWEALPHAIARRRKGLEKARAPAARKIATWAEAQRIGAAEREHRERERLAAERAARAAKEAARAEAQRLVAAERERRERERLAAERAARSRKDALLQRLTRVFETNFLRADDFFAHEPDGVLLSEADYNGLKARFVMEWAKRRLGESLDLEQASAVAAVRGNVAVTARAGSGKTRTLVTRAIFLQLHCHVSPQEILLLAFNAAAAEEMQTRLAKALGSPIPFVMTFHALAHRLVHPEEDLLYDDPSSNEFAMSRELQPVIDRHLADAEFGPQIRDLMIAHFRQDWERIVNGRINLSIEEFLAYRRSLPRETLGGEYVKSFGERVIANTLLEHGIEYRYEKNRRWNGTNYRPDFTIDTGTRSGVAIEYFGLAGDADYDEMSEAKRRYWATQEGWTLLEYSPKDLTTAGETAFIHRLLADLNQVGIASHRRSEEEIWEIVRDRAISDFTLAMGTFVRRARKRNFEPQELDAAIRSHVPCSTAERLFLAVGCSVYREYLRLLSANEKEDFDGLMWRAVEEVRAGRTLWNRSRTNEHGDLARLRFVMVDEFQDFSEQFLSLVESIRARNPRVQLFCVGDDWQAINGFAGADPEFLLNFERYFNDVHRRTISTNYRSATSVVEVGNEVMRGMGVPARPAKKESGAVWSGGLDRFNPTPSERTQHGGDEITPAVLRLLTLLLARGLDVVLLARRHSVPYFVNHPNRRTKVQDNLQRFCEHVRSFLPPGDRERVTASTAHSYKGREQQAVIVIDAVAGAYPLLHPHWVFLRFFGDNIGELVAEERRLFYVATSRAQELLVLVNEGHRPSPFLVEIGESKHLDSVSWDVLSPAPSLNGARVEIRVGNAAPKATITVRDALKDLGYHWNVPNQYWAKAVLAEGFSVEALRSQPWASAPDLTIKVYSETGDLIERIS